jgi:hypothetical protein
MERYLSGMSHPEDFHEDPRLGWGCLLTEKEWRLLNERFDAIRVKTTEHREISLAIRSYFAEAVVAVRVVTRLFENPSLVPEGHALKTYITRDYGSTPRANILEDVAPRLRISLLSSRRNDRGELLFKPIESSNGSDAGCLIPSGSEQLTRESVEALKLASRMRLRPRRSIPPRYCGVAFP